MFSFSTRSTPLLLGLALVLLLPACSATSVPQPVAQATSAAVTAPEPSPTIAAPAGATDSATTLAPTAIPSDLASRLDTFLNKLVEQEIFSGSVLVARAGTVLLKKAYGLANREHAVPNTPQTKFRLGSITKQFTAMAILLLQQQGKLTVDDRICTYLEDCPAAWQTITIHQLLTHTSGMPNFTDFLDYRKIITLPTSPRELIARFKDKPLDFKPGEQWRYGNSGYIVLGMIIERVSGDSYEQFLQKNIFEPLQLADTGYDHSSFILKNRADGYQSKLFHADYIDMSIPYAAGGLYSTVEDLYRWDQALNTEQLVPKTLLDAMFTAHAVLPPPEEGGYGYGWYIGKRFDRLWIIHGGAIEGFSTGIERYPDDKVSIIVLSNQEGTDVGEITSHLARMIFEGQ